MSKQHKTFVWLVAAREGGYEPYEWTVSAHGSESAALAMAADCTARTLAAKSRVPDEYPAVGDSDQVWDAYSRKRKRALKLIEDINGGCENFDVHYFVGRIPFFKALPHDH